jgi:hypothetical protein
MVQRSGVNAKVGGADFPAGEHTFVLVGLDLGRAPKVFPLVALLTDGILWPL